MPDFLPWTALNDRYNKVADIEACVQDVEGLKHPVKAVTYLRAEDSKHKEDDRDFREASRKAVKNICIVAKLDVEMNVKDRRGHGFYG